MTTRVPDEMLESGGGGGGGGFALPSGTVLLFAGASTTAPDGFLFCRGQAVSRTTFAALFTSLGTAYGVGDGTTTFNVPDLRGRLPLGRDNMGGVPANRVTSAVSGVDAATLGAVGGDQRLHGHAHGVTDPGHTHGTTGSFASNNGANTDAMQFGVGLGTGSVNSATTGVSVNTAGGGASQNVPPVLVVNYIVKT